MSAATPVIIHTDGSCLGNPGPGGWAALLRWGDHEKALSGGYRHTTNNRMELLAVIEALGALSRPCAATVFTDSQYVRNAIEKRWLAGWQQKGWLNAEKKPVKNRDLWERLLPLLERHQVVFRWLRGHAGHADNERCDQLAKAAAMGVHLAEDTGYAP